MTEKTSAEIIDSLCSYIDDHTPADSSEKLASLARFYYSHTSIEDLLAYSQDALYASLLSHWRFAEQRLPDAFRIRVYNPVLEEHGWESPHTMIETINADMPFLVDSIHHALRRYQLGIYHTIHPVMSIKRDTKGFIRKIEQRTRTMVEDEQKSESWIRIAVERNTDARFLRKLEHHLYQVFADVRVAVRDWHAILEQLKTTRQQLANIHHIEPALLEEIDAFCAWLITDHFTFTGYCYLRCNDIHGLSVEKGSGLGILAVDRRPFQEFSDITPLEPGEIDSQKPLVISKANMVSLVHRSAPIDQIAVRVYDEQGRCCGEHRFFGLFTATAYNRSPRDIPILRRRIRSVIDRATMPGRGHRAKTLLNILDTLPRDELFHAGTDELFRIGTGILQMENRQQVRSFVRHDPYRRFTSVLIYLPLDRYRREVHQAFEQVLLQELDATQASLTPAIGEDILARVYAVVYHREPGHLPEYDPQHLEELLSDAARTWHDHLRSCLLERYGEEKGLSLFRHYQHAIPAAYSDDFSPLMAAVDLAHIARLQEEGAVHLSLYHKPEHPPFIFRFKMFHCGEPVLLSHAMPMLENMGMQVLSERPYEIKDGTIAGRTIWIHDFELMSGRKTEEDLHRLRDPFEHAFMRIWQGKLENDTFNHLILNAGLEWREVSLLRAYGLYMRQAGLGFSFEYIARTLSANASVTRLLIRWFETRFDPKLEEGKRQQEEEYRRQELNTAMALVLGIDEDRILQAFISVIGATLRTNYYHRDESDQAPVCYAFKFNSDAIAILPLPKPRYEIFMTTPEVEGIHLRGGKVARGGIRWSDRREDYRTEVLGLMKAQMVKNSVIIPVGAKGGFVVKNLTQNLTREEVFERVHEAYRTFIGALLCLTDNFNNERVEHPQQTICHDGDDPYLVVAADKGTATFSDTANDIAIKRNFWLGDSFASGGKTGYDHKKMGITARGAWESLKAHIHDLGKNPEKDIISVVGIGDMSGDVFGNGMLLSRTLRLIAAFDHRHIFIDPNPDLEESYAARERLFQMKRSSWADYDATAISSGGGVYTRQVKSIALSPQIQEALDFRQDRSSPHELIQAILKAPVDVLWNGGIGTFVKARWESHVEVEDRANDNIRVNGCELCCAIVAEGGNLGLTQPGRIEYAMNGGRINTDFIDNSAGVDCSDHEVNLKIGLDLLIRDGDLTYKQRNELLARMSEEVSDLVLKDNQLQTQALSIMVSHGSEMIDEHHQLIRSLEQTADLNRDIEHLPSERQITERKMKGLGLTRPELAIVLSYTKNSGYSALLRSSVPDHPWMQRLLLEYFPSALRQSYPQAIYRHPLKREIIATMTANELINRMSISLPQRLHDDMNVNIAEISLAYFTAREVYDAEEVWEQMDALDHSVPAQLQYQMRQSIQQLIEHSIRWLLERPGINSQPPQTIIDVYRRAIVLLWGCFSHLLEPTLRERYHHEISRYLGQKIPEPLARSMAAIPFAMGALDITEQTRQRVDATLQKHSLIAVAQANYYLGSHLHLDELYTWMLAFPVHDHWELSAKGSLLDDLYRDHASLAARIIAEEKSEDGFAAARQWMDKYEEISTEFISLLQNIQAQPSVSYSALSVAGRHLRRMATGAWHANQVSAVEAETSDEKSLLSVKEPLIKS